MQNLQNKNRPPEFFSGYVPAIHFWGFGFQGVISIDFVCNFKHFFRL